MPFFGLKQSYTQDEAKSYFFDRSVPSRVIVQDYMIAKEQFVGLSVDDQLELIHLVAERGVFYTARWLAKNCRIPNKKIGKQMVMYAACYGRGGLMCRAVKNFNGAKKFFAKATMQFN